MKKGIGLNLVTRGITRSDLDFSPKRSRQLMEEHLHSETRKHPAKAMGDRLVKKRIKRADEKR